MSFTKRKLVKIIALTIVPWSSMYKTDLKKKQWLVFEIIAGGKNQEILFFIVYRRYNDFKSIKRLFLPSKKAQLLKGEKNT